MSLTQTTNYWYKEMKATYHRVTIVPHKDAKGKKSLTFSQGTTVIHLNYFALLIKFSCVKSKVLLPLDI